MSPESVLQKLLLGTTRSNLEVSGEWCAGIAAQSASAPLQLLALASQARRLQIPRLDVEFDPLPHINDTRVLISDPARRLLLKLIETGPADSSIAKRCALALMDRKLRPHPFDFPRAAAFIRRQADFLGASASAYAARNTTTSTPEPLSYFEPDDVTLDNWTSASPARKAQFLSQLRQRDPGQALTLIAQQLPHEKAEVRLRLLAVLAIQLSAADQSVLESAALDRAPKVKALAQQLLLRLPNTAVAHAHLQTILARITRDDAHLKLELPLTVNKSPMQTQLWIAENFAGLGLSALAQALGLSAAQLIAAAQKNQPLLLALSMGASNDLDFLSLQAIAEHHADLWSEAAPHCLGLLQTDTQRIAWIERVFRPKVMPETPDPAPFWRMLDHVDSTLPHALAQNLIDYCRLCMRKRAEQNSEADSARDARAHDWLNPLAILSPTTLHPQLVLEAEATSLGRFHPALLWIDFIAELDAQTGNDPISRKEAN